MALSAKRLRAIQHLTTGSTITATAQEVGVSRGTLYRWLREPEFAAEFECQSNQLLVTAQAYGHSLLTGALETLNEVMADPESRNSDRVRAAQVALSRVPAEQVMQIQATVETEPKEDRGRAWSLEELVGDDELAKMLIADRMLHKIKHGEPGEITDRDKRLYEEITGRKFAAESSTDIEMVEPAATEDTDPVEPEPVTKDAQELSPAEVEEREFQELLYSGAVFEGETPPPDDTPRNITEGTIFGKPKSNSPMAYSPADRARMRQVESQRATPNEWPWTQP